jgi:hypothetical protein
MLPRCSTYRSLDYQGLWVRGRIPDGPSSGPMRWAKPWDSHAVWSQVCLGAHYDVSLRVMASWPTQEQTDLAPGSDWWVTLPMDQCLGLSSRC